MQIPPFPIKPGTYARNRTFDVLFKIIRCVGVEDYWVIYCDEFATEALVNHSDLVQVYPDLTYAWGALVRYVGNDRVHVVRKITHSGAPHKILYSLRNMSGESTVRTAEEIYLPC
jgi:hypothetical protein